MSRPPREVDAKVALQGAVIAPSVPRTLPTSVGFRLRRAQLAYNRLFSHFAEGSDIPLNQIGVLALISRNPGITPGELATLLTLDAGQITPILKQLVERGLITRLKSPTDNRSHSLQTTPIGEEEYHRLQAVVAKVDEEFLTAVLSEQELQQLVALLGRLENAAKLRIASG